MRITRNSAFQAHLGTPSDLDEDARAEVGEALTPLIADLVALYIKTNLLTNMRELHAVCDARDDVATSSLLETFIDETERRIWFLFETAGGACTD
jgi:starvation-inducible DNA-binding protein